MYAPAAAGTGTLTLNYTYKNNAGEAKTGTVTSPTARRRTITSSGHRVEPTLAVLTGSSTPVTVTFTTDDGNLASALSVTSGLAALPAGWSSASSSFSCASVSVGACCQLALTYAPTAAATGTLTLGFNYTNDAGIAKTGTVSIAYTATP